MNPRANQPDSISKPDRGDQSPRPRLNLLLSYGGWRERSAVDQIPHLLSPMGIHAIRVKTGREATEVIASHTIHIAVVDLAIPLESTTGLSDACGVRLLQLLQRITPTPPTVIVRPPQPASREHVRGLTDALRGGAFAVLDRPIQMETMLETMRRIVRRHYADLWPAA